MTASQPKKRPTLAETTYRFDVDLSRNVTSVTDTFLLICRSFLPCRHIFAAFRADPRGMKRLLLALLFACTASAQIVDVAPASPIAGRIHAAVTSRPSSDLQALYALSGYEPAWIRDGRLTTQALVVIEALEQAGARGLRPIDDDAASWRIRTLDDPARFDVDLTRAALRYLRHVSTGRIDPHAAGIDFDVTPRVFLPAVLRDIATSDTPAVFLASVEPRHPQYRGLLEALTSADPVSARRIALTLERWRWLPDDRDGLRSIEINIPEFLLRASDAEGNEELVMRIVVGAAKRHRTPMLSSTMRTVVFRPYWNVPPSIQRNEIVPKVRRDATYLVRNNYELTGEAQSEEEMLEQLRSGAIRLRQKPGPSNVLGLAKFVFPNDRNIYLHSTPSQSHFARTRRDFSHGCIRVEDPAELAAWALDDWSRRDAERAMNGHRDDHYVRVDDPVSIRIHYATVAVQEGELVFFDDIYGWDAALARAMEPARPGAMAP